LYGTLMESKELDAIFSAAGQFHGSRLRLAQFIHVDSPAPVPPFPADILYEGLHISVMYSCRLEEKGSEQRRYQQA